MIFSRVTFSLLGTTLLAASLTVAACGSSDSSDDDDGAGGTEGSPSAGGSAGSPGEGSAGSPSEGSSGSSGSSGEGGSAGTEGGAGTAGEGGTAGTGGGGTGGVAGGGAGGVAGGGAGGAPGEATFTDVKKLFAKYGCNGCHGTEGGLTLGDKAFENLVGTAPANKTAPECTDGRVYVDPKHPETSYLIDKLKGTNLCGDPKKDLRMPRNGPPYLSEDEIATVSAWIAAGAKNDLF